MRRRDVLAGAGSLAAGATAGFPAPAIAQGIRQLKMVTDWPEGMPGLAHQRGPFRADDRRRDRRPHQDRGFSGRRACAPVRDLRRGRGGRRRHVSFVRRLLRKEVAGVAFLRGHPLWLHRGRTVRVGPVRRRSRAVGRAQRAVQHQVAPVHQHRLPDGRVVHPRDHLAGRITRGCATGWAGSAPRCSGGWAPSW